MKPELSGRWYHKEMLSNSFCVCDKAPSSSCMWPRLGQTGTSSTKDNVKCYHCKGVGHYAYECQKKFWRKLYNLLPTPLRDEWVLIKDRHRLTRHFVENLPKDLKILKLVKKYNNMNGISHSNSYENLLERKMIETDDELLLKLKNKKEIKREIIEKKFKEKEGIEKIKEEIKEEIKDPEKIEENKKEEVVKELKEAKKNYKEEKVKKTIVEYVTQPDYDMADKTKKELEQIKKKIEENQKKLNEEKDAWFKDDGLIKKLERLVKSLQVKEVQLENKINDCLFKKIKVEKEVEVPVKFDEKKEKKKIIKKIEKENPYNTQIVDKIKKANDDMIKKKQTYKIIRHDNYQPYRCKFCGDRDHLPKHCPIREEMKQNGFTTKQFYDYDQEYYDGQLDKRFMKKIASDKNAYYEK